MRSARKSHLPWLVCIVCLTGGSGPVEGGARNFSLQEVAAGSPHSRLLDARKLLASGRFQEAEDAVREYLSEHQTSADAHYLLGLILFRKIRAEALEAGAAGTGASQPSIGTRKFREEQAKASLAEYTEGAKYE